MGTLSVRTAAVVVIGALGALGVSQGALAAAPASQPTQAKLTAAEGTADAKFGTSVWIEGNTAVVGAPDEDGVEDGMGAAYVFTRQGAAWIQEAMLVASDPGQGGKFGYDVGLSGDTIVVGAPNADQTPIPGPGAAYVFVRTRDGWVQQAKLSAPDGKTDDAFGFAVSISGDTVVVGANDGTTGPGTTAGAAYVFTRAGGTWSEQAKLTPADGLPDDNFGYSVVVSGDTAVVGVRGDDIGAAVDQGSARVYTRHGAIWTEQATLTPQDASPAGLLGNSVSLSGDTVVVGAPTGSSGTNLAHGSAYVFTRDGERWTPDAKLTAPDGAPADQFGSSVAVTGDTVAVGAHFSHVTEGRYGAVYVFERARDGWAMQTKITGTDAGGILGVSTAISGRTLIAGANFAAVDDNAAQGAAYVYDLRPAPAGVAKAEPATSAPRSGSAPTPAPGSDSATPSAPGSGSVNRLVGAGSGFRRSDTGLSLPSTGSDTGTRVFLALIAIVLGRFLALSARSAVR